MGYKVILIENDVKMSIKLNNIIINKEGHDIWISVDDVSLLVIDNMKITLTSRMLSYLAEHNVGMIFCDAKHLPIGYYCDYDNHSHISKILNYQIQYSQTEYDKLWKKIIIAKLNNQARVLEILGKDNDIALKIKEYCDEITDGDKSNREAHGAKVYFNELMGTSFSRGNEDLLLNSGLDYGYTIIRSFIARLCVGYGLNCQIGIHHKNEYNRFNLVDDLMEPLRPILMIMRSMQMRYDVMRVLCMFDLPVDTDKEKREYRNFKKKLILEGFVMLQYSVYIRTCPNRQYSERLQKRLAKNLPANGNIRLLEITEKQYEDMKILVGTKNLNEKIANDERFVVI